MIAARRLLLCFLISIPVLAQEADGRECAQHQIALMTLQQLTRPVVGTHSTPEQDRISNQIAAHYSFIQQRRAYWHASPKRAAFDQAFAAGMHDPALKKIDPFAPVPIPGAQQSSWAPTSDAQRWLLLAALIGGVVLICYLISQALKLISKALGI